MTKREALESALADVPDDELIFVVRGSHPAAPETLRTFAQRVLALETIAMKQTPESKAAARKLANDVFAMADRMEAHEANAPVREAERKAGLTADGENERLERERFEEHARRLAESVTEES